MLPAVIGLLVAVAVLFLVWRLLRALLLVAVVLVAIALVVGFSEHHLHVHARAPGAAVAAVGHTVSRDASRLERSVRGR